MKLNIYYMKKKLPNLTFILISIIPTALLLFLFKNLIPNPQTKISGSNGIVLNKIEFVFAIIVLSFIGYIFAKSISKSNQFLIQLNPIIIRLLTNIVFSVLIIMLILSNIK